ncbi:hypothetical protein D3C74_379300 [compost metagenome]
MATATPRESASSSEKSLSSTTCSSRASSTGVMVSGKSPSTRAKLAVPDMMMRWVLAAWAISSKACNTLSTNGSDCCCGFSPARVSLPLRSASWTPSKLLSSHSFRSANSASEYKRATAIMRWSTVPLEAIMTISTWELPKLSSSRFFSDAVS